MANAQQLDLVLHRLTSRPEGQGLSPSDLRVVLKDEHGVRASLAQIKESLGRKNNTQPKLFRYDRKLYSHVRTTGVRGVNAVHHADTLHLTTDRGKSYALVVKDAASRFVAAEPMPDKTTDSVIDAFTKIYGRGKPLQAPSRINVDPGTEFQGQVPTFMRQMGTHMYVGHVGDHKHAGLAESANRVIAQRLYARQHEKEEATGLVNREWIAALSGVLARMNKQVSSSTGEKPADAVKQEDVEQKPLSSKAKKLVKAMRNDSMLQVGQLVRKPLDEPADGGSWRATDLKWSNKTPIEEVRVVPDRPPEYKLRGDARWWMGRQLNIY